jgi:hypothetical protein
VPEKFGCVRKNHYLCSVKRKKKENNTKLMMKKIIMVMAVALMTALSVNAQNEELKHELGISYGAGVSVIGDGIGNAVGRGIWELGLGGYEWKDDKQFGTLALEYYYHLNNPRVAVGGILTYAQYGEDVYKKSSNTMTGERTRHYISMMPSIKYYWVNGNHFGLYSKAAIGPMMMMEKEKDDELNKDDTTSRFYFMFQASLLGIEFGGRLRGFAEVGGGEQGIVLAGLKYKF